MLCTLEAHPSAGESIVLTLGIPVSAFPLASGDWEKAPVNEKPIASYFPQPFEIAS